VVAERFATARTLQQALIVSSSIARTFDIEAAQSAAKHFADVLTPCINLGLVEFAANATLLVAPTTNRAAMKAAIDKLQPADRTATGEGIFTAAGHRHGGRGDGRHRPLQTQRASVHRHQPLRPRVPWTAANQLGRDWCALGADVQFWTNEQPPFLNKAMVNHALTMLVEGERGMQWIADRFNGLPTTPNCGQF
jgi:hypothetical protein